MCMPAGHKTELAGLYVSCTQILGWFPPLIFTVVVEAEVSQTYGTIAGSGFFLIAAGLVSCAGSWSEIFEECGRDPSIGKCCGGIDAKSIDSSDMSLDLSV